MERLNKFRVWLLGNPLLVALLFAPFFRPGCLNDLFDWIYVCWKGVSMLCIVACFLARPKLSALTVLLAAYQILLAAMTLIRASGESLSSWMFTTASIVMLCVLLDECVEADPKALVKGLFGCLGILILINLATVLLYPGGMHYTQMPDYYFMGRDNSHPFFIIPLLAVTAMYGWHRQWKWYTHLAVSVVFCMSIYLTWSAAGVVAASAFLVLLVPDMLEEREPLAKYRGRLCNICVYYCAVAAVFLLLIVLKAPSRFSFLIENVLHKNVMLSGRTVLWEKVTPLVTRHLFFGNGMVTWEDMSELVGEINCHNVILQCLFDTGLVGLGLFMAALGLLIKPLMHTRKSYCGCALAAAVFAGLMDLQAESLVHPLPYYTLFMLAYHADLILPALEPAKEE